MLISLVKAEGIPLEQRRGVETTDRNILFVLVKASVETVAKAFSELRQMNIWVRDAYECEIDVQNESTFLFQFKGHPWSLIYKPHMSSRLLYLTEEDACSISESLNTSTIYYAGSDTCGIIEYSLYTNGICLEKLSFEEGIRRKFQSQLRQITNRDIRNVYRFTMNFISEQDAYIPCLVEVEELIAGQRTILWIENLIEAELERIDYLAQQ